MTNKNNTLFLDAYKSYETILRQHGLEYKDIEDNSDDITQNRMRICRQMRNYLTHNDDPNFLEISDAQIEYMRRLYNEELEKEDLVKNHVKSASTSMVTLKDKCGDALAKMVKLKTEYIGVYKGDEVLGVASIYDVSKAYQTSKTTKMSTIKLSSKFGLATPNTLVSDIHHDRPVFACKENGKLLGWVKL